MALIEVTKREGVALLTLNFAPANCYTHEMMRELDAAILDARFDENVHVLMLTGMGEKFFCAGADIKMLASVTPYFKYNFCLHANETLNRLEQTTKLVIAAINGNCVGGGLEIAMAADIRIAKNANTYKFGLPEITLGVLPGTGGTQRLCRIVGNSKAIELMTTAQLFDANEAVRLGLVNTLLGPEAFMEKAFEYAKQFCPPNKASKAVGLIKRSVQSGSQVGFQDALAIERELQQQLFQSEDAKVGLSSYIEKKKPEFKGK